MKYHSTLDPSIIFYIGQQHKDFRDVFLSELEELEKKEMKYRIFEELDRAIPELCINGSCVVGRKDIVNELANFLSKK